MMAAMRSILLLLVVALLPACFASRTTTNRLLDPQKIAQLRPGVSTAAQVVELLGAPSEVVQLGRRSAYRYESSVRKEAGLFLLVLVLDGVDSHSDRVWVFFDEHDVLTHVGATLEAELAEYALPGSGTSGSDRPAETEQP